MNSVSYQKAPLKQLNPSADMAKEEKTIDMMLPILDEILDIDIKQKINP